MSKIKVVIIDDGVDLDTQRKLKVSCKVLKNGCVVDDIPMYQNMLTHGSKCVNIFAKYAKNYELYCLKILDVKTRRTDITSLKQGLEWCLSEKIDLVSLSLGSVQMADYLKLIPILERIKESSMIVIAACDNDYQMTFPASDDNIIGVKADKFDVLAEGEYIYDSSDIFNIQIMVGSLKKIFPDFNLDNHNSYVTPYVAALVCNMLVKGIKKNQVEEKLKIRATNKVKGYYPVFERCIKMEKGICTQLGFLNPISNSQIEGLVNTFLLHGYRVLAIVDKKEDNNILLYCYDEILKRIKIDIENERKISIFIGLIKPDLVLWNISKEKYEEKISDLLDGIISIEEITYNQENFCEEIYKYIKCHY